SALTLSRISTPRYPLWKSKGSYLVLLLWMDSFMSSVESRNQRF
ncbi:unnamed protein product, partial [Allacma fusca]